MKRRIPLHVHISTLFLGLILLVGGSIGVLSYRASRGILESSAAELSARIGRETSSEFTKLLAPAAMATRLLSFDGLSQMRSLEERLRHLGFLREALSSSPALVSVYVGYDNGDFLMLRQVQNDAERRFFEAPEQTAYIVQSIDHPGGAPRGRYIFLDATLTTLRVDERPDYPGSYDPRSRDWYKAARAAPGQIKTAPYVFFTSQKVGTTLANRSSTGNAVIGADIQLETLDRLLTAQKVTPGSQIVLANQAGRTVAYQEPGKAILPAALPEGRPGLAGLADLGAPVLAKLAPLLASAQAEARDLALEVDGEAWHASIQPVIQEGAPPLFLVIAIPDRDLMAAARTLVNHAFIAIALVMALTIPMTWSLARRIAGPMRQLAADADAIRHFEFSRPIAVDSMVQEVDELATTMDGMKRAIRRFLDISVVVAAESNFDRLMPRLLSETLSPAGADAGVLYLADQDKLVPASLLKADGTALPATAPEVAQAAAGPLLGGALQAGKARAGRLEALDIQALGLGPALEACGASHGMAVPLLNRQHHLVGALLLLGHAEVDAARLRFVEALSGSAAVSLETKELIRAQKRLFEAFIQLLAGAIDAKSPYTGGHCARVPELAKMLARAACAETSGPYKDFQLNEEEWEAVHLAAWLHDCGKVTTPEYVVDKATKLETLYDRIHEVRMRFEVLKRDAEIDCLRAIAAGEPEAPARARLGETLARLDDDFAFVATCNEGGESMDAASLERLQSIATRTWTRTLDDRIGISHEELERKDRLPPSPLPVTEPLLADKPEHRFERRPQDHIAPDNPWGFRMPVPELLYDKGELHNLTVARGTLSAEERYKINEHIIQTIIMLSELPFPKHLRQVPEIAGGHHEKMDGTGYPRRLRKEEMSPLARMLAIADIFEALTAVDRPYKKGKTLSESIRIMSFMKRDQHIDPDLFDLFLRSGVYRDYADRFMQPDQIDTVDLAAYLSGQPAA